MQFENMENDRMYSWMYPYLNLLGFKTGNTLVGAIIQPSNASNLSTTEADDLRQKAAGKMANISDEERTRRREMGYICYIIAASYIFSTVLLDDGSLLGHFIRFAVFLLLVSG